MIDIRYPIQVKGRKVIKGIYTTLIENSPAGPMGDIDVSLRTIESREGLLERVSYRITMLGVTKSGTSFVRHLYGHKFEIDEKGQRPLVGDSNIPLLSDPNSLILSGKGAGLCYEFSPSDHQLIKVEVRPVRFAHSPRALAVFDVIDPRGSSRVYTDYVSHKIIKIESPAEVTITATN